MTKKQLYICLSLVAIIFSLAMTTVADKAEEFKRTQEYEKQAYLTTLGYHATDYTTEDIIALETVVEPLWEEYTFTAYDGCKDCCDNWADNRPNGIVYGAACIELTQGISVASPLPFGTQIETETGEIYTVQDRTSEWIVNKYDGKIIDVYFNNHEDADNFGKKTMKVRILK